MVALHRICRVLPHNQVAAPGDMVRDFRQHYARFSCHEEMMPRNFLFVNSLNGDGGQEPGGRKKQVQARGKSSRCQSLFFTALAFSKREFSLQRKMCKRRRVRTATCRLALLGSGGVR
jgi:hypothetical protein